MSIPDRVAVLFANEAFYAAFANRDYAAMDRLWSRQHPVTCIHPGWQPLIGREAVMQSWQGILAHPSTPQIRCHDATAILQGEVAYVLCYEVLENGHLAATNIFVRESEVWRLVHHQAGASPAPPAQEEDAPPPVQ
ncbi:MAG: nuclear transport factor 2 family protein [Rhodospirillales bacterium]